MGILDKFNKSETDCANETSIETSGCLGLPCHQGHCETRFDFLNDIFERNCTCYEGWQGVQCNKCCMLPCVNGVCVIDDFDGALFCDCDVFPNRYTGPYCEELVPNATVATVTLVEEKHIIWNTTSITLTAVFSVAFALLVLFSLLFFYILYKKRYLLALKIVHYFKKFEDDEKRMFDVFFSYNVQDDENRQFVVKTLLPGIEEFGYKACLDVRDIKGGEYVNESIVLAIRESRRTILVISPEYLEGIWKEFEIQSALMEMLTKDHRIIPIMFKPLDRSKDEISLIMKHILNLVSYIEWPNCADEKEQKKKLQQFWSRLKLALPKLKKKILDPEEDLYEIPIPNLVRVNGGFLVEKESNKEYPILRSDVFIDPKIYQVQA